MLAYMGKEIVGVVQRAEELALDLGNAVTSRLRLSHG